MYRTRLRFPESSTRSSDVRKYVFTKSGRNLFDKGSPLEDLVEGEHYSIEILPYRVLKYRSPKMRELINRQFGGKMPEQVIGDISENYVGDQEKNFLRGDYSDFSGHILKKRY